MVLSEEIKEMATAFADAMRTAITGINPNKATDGQPGTDSIKPPPFSFQAFRSSDGTTVADYFTRLEWALELSKIPESQYASYALVYMGTELNDALKFLISPAKPEDATYADIVKKLKAILTTQKINTQKA